MKLSALLKLSGASQQFRKPIIDFTSFLDLTMFEYFGFREHPFRLTSDPRFLYPNPGHQEAYASLVYGVTQRRGFVVLTGEMGTGKTMLLRRLMEEFANSVRFAFVHHTTWSFDKILDAVCYDFDLPSLPDAGQFDKIQALNAFLLQQLAQGKTAAILIDEGQNLGNDVLENLRLLSNLETGSEKLFQIILVGQNELESKLQQPALRQIKNRVAVWSRLERLKKQEVGPFIAHRLRIAGYEGPGLFTDDAIHRIAAYSQGRPRQINILCDNALLTAYGTHQSQVSVEIVEKVAWDLGLSTNGRPPEKKSSVVEFFSSTPQSTSSLVQSVRSPEQVRDEGMVTNLVTWTKRNSLSNDGAQY
jgi:general secretion pathway protein A